MKISNRVDRLSGTTAAVLTLIMQFSTLVINLIATSAMGGTGAMITIVMNAVTLVVLCIALFRRKKDTVSAVLFLVAALPGAVGLVSHVINLVTGASNSGQVAAWIVSNLVSIAFYVLVALECFSPGMLSGSSARKLLVILPIVRIFLSAFATYGPQLANAVEWGNITAILGQFLAIYIYFGMDSWAIFIGMAYAKPICEAQPDCVVPPAQ